MLGKPIIPMQHPFVLINPSSNERANELNSSTPLPVQCNLKFSSLNPLDQCISPTVHALHTSRLHSLCLRLNVDSLSILCRKVYATNNASSIIHQQLQFLNASTTCYSVIAALVFQSIHEAVQTFSSICLHRKINFYRNVNLLCSHHISCVLQLQCFLSCCPDRSVMQPYLCLHCHSDVTSFSSQSTNLVSICLFLSHKFSSSPLLRALQWSYLMLVP